MNYEIPSALKGDLDPEGERLICEYVKKAYDSEFVFIVDFPAKARAFYSMKKEEDEELTKTYDLLFRGVEITSGAQREHRIENLRQNIIEKGINPDNMKEYLTSSNEQFMEICKKIALAGYNLGARNITPTKYGCKMVATIAKQDSWMNVRQQVFLILFFRESDLIEDTILRKSIEEMKSQNYFKCIVCTCSGFTRTAMAFAENRPFELVPKEKLQVLLEKAKI
jgi:hypothetical protein